MSGCARALPPSVLAAAFLFSADSNINLTINDGQTITNITVPAGP